MGFLGNLFKKDSKTSLEKYLDSMTPATMNKDVKTLDESLIVPYDQAMTVLLFSRSFTKGLKKSAQEAPWPFRTSWQFQHDRIFAEVVAFYYFVLMKDFLVRDLEEEDEDYDDEEDEEYKDGKPSDPYFKVLQTSLHLANDIVLELADAKFPENFIMLRTLSFSSIHQSKEKNIIDALTEFIMNAWNPEPDGSGRLSLSLSTPTIAILTYVKSMPIEEVSEICRNFYDEKLRNSKAFSKLKVSTSVKFPS